MPDYISYNLITGKIIDKFYSVDPKVVEGRNDILELPRDEFNALTIFHKVDFGVVRLMTQAEKDAMIAAEAQARITEEAARLVSMDTSIGSVKIVDFPMVKVDGVIDAIANLADAKLFLKRLCRYVAKNSGYRI